MKSLGICIGASTLSVVEGRKDSAGQIYLNPILIEPHSGNPREALIRALKDLAVTDDIKVAVTGRKLRQSVKLSSLSEPEAVETALYHMNGHSNNPDAIISAGGENFLVYVLGKDGKICAVKTGNKCASGTGEFFVQQLRRIGLSLDDAVQFASHERPYKVSGRCSVFCKSDCTHATNKGIPKDRIVAGLCEMIGGKILEITRQIPGSEKIMVIGGLARNRQVIDHLKAEIPDLIVPAEAYYYEALGAAVWALGHETLPLSGVKEIFSGTGSTFSSLPSLRNARDMVEFKELERGAAWAGDRCILGLDVGSTTTKATLVRMSDDRIVASIYLRTNGNPLEASRSCITSIYDQLGDLAERIEIAGVGVTGSGRQIAGLYTMTDGVINEIIAHATGALFFDPTVDTIFEIGGQDAKYTYIHQGVPSDYAMNDACSAGTGSFLEEAARETMGVDMREIGPLALLGENPPNFSDQCAAFISSDIKHAFQDGLTREDILAGLVYSICMNYSNRVKGNRQVGKRIFMQGGVCYNQAVPMAMASLTGKNIVVPPEPGLLGAFGVALEVKRRLKLGMLKEGEFSLKVMKERTFEHREPFICDGGEEKCDRKCEITRIRIEGKTYPFGGACNRWYNIRAHIKVDTERLDLIKRYERIVFHDAGKAEKDIVASEAPTIGMNKSFFINTFYPLYRHFFRLLGFRVQLAEALESEGVDYKGAAFCYPAEIAHGFFLNLLGKDPDYLFLPQVKGLSVEGEECTATTCPLSQGEPYYLSTAFKMHDAFAKLKKEGKVLTPVLDFSKGMGEVEKALSEMARVLDVGPGRAGAAFAEAQKFQEELTREMKERCLDALAELEKDPERQAIVILGRTYNAFVSEANMGIPQKIASRGVPVLPFAFLPLEGEAAPEEMYWATGRVIMKAVEFIARHPQLFPCYISNFSCGPDSFILEYVRFAMGKKPFLILELDSHVADAGLETRIEAFLDIIHNYRELEKRSQAKGRSTVSAFRPARYDQAKRVFIDSFDQAHGFLSPRVKVLIPSMGYLGSEALAAVFRSAGIRTNALPPADEEVLRLGRGNTSGKECLPLLITLGSLLKYLKEHREDNEILVYFMPTASGPCRFGQYSYFIRQIIAQMEIPNLTLFSSQAEDGYKDIGGNKVRLKLSSAAFIAECFEDAHSMILANAADREGALRLFHQKWQEMLAVMERTPDFRSLKKAFARTAVAFAGIRPLKPWSRVPTVLLNGEIFVRRDDISRQFIVERLAEQGFAVKTAGLMEWIFYTDYCYAHDLSAVKAGMRDKIMLYLRTLWLKAYETAYQKIAAGSSLVPARPVDVKHIIESAEHLVNPQLTGEAILTVGGAITEVPRNYCGVIAIGPFGCMPNRLSEAILSREMGQGWQGDAKRTAGIPRGVVENIAELPFLAIESDGNPFPQVITAKLEVFLSQAARLHQAMQE